MSDVDGRRRAEYGCRGTSQWERPLAHAMYPVVLGHHAARHAAYLESNCVPNDSLVSGKLSDLLSLRGGDCLIDCPSVWHPLALGPPPILSISLAIQRRHRHGHSEN